MIICPKCNKTTDVIRFNEDTDFCEACKIWFPTVEEITLLQQVPMGNFTIGVFPVWNPGDVPKFTAYTLWYDHSWPHCCKHQVRARGGMEARKEAIREHREKCSGNEEHE